jgi:hypothetical protein
MSKETIKELAIRLIELLSKDDEKDEVEKEKEKFTKMTPVELLRHCVELSEREE